MSICHICGKDISKTNYCERCKFTPKRPTPVQNNTNDYKPIRTAIDSLLQANSRITSGDYDEAKKLLVHSSEALKKLGKNDKAEQAIQLSQRLDEDNYNAIRNEVVSILRALGYV